MRTPPVMGCVLVFVPPSRLASTRQGEEGRPLLFLQLLQQQCPLLLRELV